MRIIVVNDVILENSGDLVEENLLYLGIKSGDLYIGLIFSCESDWDEIVKYI